MKKKPVEMDDFAFTTDKNLILTSEGITTCIAFVVLGTFWDDEDDEIDFCGLYHWSGFNPATSSEQCASILDCFFMNLQNFLQTEDPITLNALIFIGGEKALYNEQQELMVSGTESEVVSLIQAVKDYDFIDDDFIIATENIKHLHFLTENNEAISLEVSTSYYRYKKEFVKQNQQDIDSTFYLKK
ncbi:MAG: hypothetical protein PSV35_09550 [bacterium]|nr:hypothetical protein [bacterium]